MSMIEDNLATLREPISVQAWEDTSEYGHEEKSKNLTNVTWLERNHTLNTRVGIFKCR